MWWTIFSGTIFCFRSSPIRRMFPRVRSLIIFSLSLLSDSCSGAVICLISSLSLSAPSKASWQLFKRILLRVISLPPGSSAGNGGRFSFRSEHSSAYMGQNVGSSTALSNINDITPCCSRKNLWILCKREHQFWQELGTFSSWKRAYADLQNVCSCYPRINKLTFQNLKLLRSQLVQNTGEKKLVNTW